MIKQKIVTAACCALLLVSGCSRQQSDWQKTRETNTADSYEQFLKKYPSGEFTAQAQARVKELYEERDWQKARDTDTPEAYQAFVKQYPEGKWTEEARIRIENFSLAQAPSGGPAVAAAPAGTIPGGSSPMGDDSPAPAAPEPPAPTAAAPLPPAKAAAPPAASPKLAAEHKGAAGKYGVQLGAFKSGRKAATTRWAHLQKTYPTLLAGLSSKVVSKKTAEGNLYRLQAIGLSEKHAREVCSALKARAQACVVVPPAHG
jgi:cell division protein FtsN